MANSKLIGNDWERELAKKLSYWFTSERDSLVVWRNSHSGSISTVRQKKGKSAVPEDICLLENAPKELFPFFEKFYLEAKTFKEVSFNFLKPAHSYEPIYSWKETIKKCPEGKIPLMFCHARDRKTPMFVLVPSNCMGEWRHFIDFRSGSVSGKIVPLEGEGNFFSKNYNYVFESF